MINQWLVDTGAWVAHYNRGDQWHKLVGEIFAELADSQVLLYTTDTVVLELVSVLRSKGWTTDRTAEVISAVRESVQQVLTGDDDLLDEVIRDLKSHGNVELSGVDLEIVAFAKRYSIYSLISPGLSGW